MTKVASIMAGHPFIYVLESGLSVKYLEPSTKSMWQTLSVMSGCGCLSVGGAV